MDIKNVTFGEKIREFLKSKFKLVHLFSDCNERSYHLHKYVKDGLVRYFPKEKLNYIEFGLLDISISSKLKKLKRDKTFESKH